MSKLLFDEYPLMVSPTLATKIGLNESLILQQIHYWLEINKKANTNSKDGYFWIFNSYDQWQEQFPFWSVSTIKRAISNLEKRKIVVSGNYNKLKIDRTKWYRIDYELLQNIENIPLSQNGMTMDSDENIPLCQNDPTIVSKIAVEEVNSNRPLPETNTKTNIYSQSVIIDNIYDNQKTEVKPSEEKITEDMISIIKDMAYPYPIGEMIINSLTDIIKTNGTKYLDRLTDRKIIDFAVNKFKKLDKTKIKNYQAYFTSILYNSIFEYAASEVVGKEQFSEDVKKNHKNRFHNFEQKMKNYSEQELEEMAKKKYSQKIQELKILRN